MNSYTPGKLYRKGRIPWTMYNCRASWRCFFGVHKWEWDIYINNAEIFLYCPNCHQQREAQPKRKDAQQ